MNKKKYILMPMGMIAVVFYFAHIIIGQLLWKEYNPITTDISTLTSIGAPNRLLLIGFTAIYGIALLLFFIGMIIKSNKEYHKITSSGWIVLLIMNLVSMTGYGLFPLSTDKTALNFTNTMHIVVTIIVVITTIAGSFLLAYGYLKKEKMKKLGNFIFISAILITLFGMLNPIGMANHWNILGLSERAVIFTLQILIFIISFYYTFQKRSAS